MSFIAGQTIAYLKVFSLGFLIMALIWAAGKIWLAFYNRTQGPPDREGPN